MSSAVLAIDQGTTGTTCLVIDLGRHALLGRGYAEVPQHFPRPGWVEHDLDEIWTSVQRAVSAALTQAGPAMGSLAAIGITNQRETTALWDTSGTPVSRAIVWQDRRTAARCAELRRLGHAPLFSARTGLVLDPYFSGTKLQWLLDDGGLRARAEAGELRAGTIDTWLLWKLTGGAVHATDVTNASRTLMLDIRTGRWDAELSYALGRIPATLLPRVGASAEVYGHTRGVPGVPDGVPIAGVAGDQHAALFGQACVTPGMAKCTYGTGAFALLNTGERCVTSAHGLLTTPAWQLGGRITYALEGSAFVAGAAVQWLRDGLGIIERSEQVEALARQVPDSGEVVVVPAFTGLGAPHWRPEARGLIAGITRGTTRAHIARATLEGIAFQVYDLLRAMQQDSGRPLELLRVDGGAAANDLLMQCQSDILGVPIHRPQNIESTALGAAYLAAVGVGLFSGPEDVSAAWRLERAYTPSSAGAAALSEALRRWHEAAAKA